MTVFHGTNLVLDTISIGSWVSDDADVARSFANVAADNGGEPLVYRLEVSEEDVAWDIVSMVSGVDDVRGTLLKEITIVK